MPEQNQNPFAGMHADPEEAQRRIDQWAQGFADKAERYEAMRAETEQVRLTASSPDGRVKVTVGADGSVTDLELTDKIRTVPPAETSALILSTMHKAQANIATKVGEVMTAHLGEEDAQTQSMMLDNLRERFPEPDEDTVAEPETSGKWDAPVEDEPPAPPTPPKPTTSGPGTEPPTPPGSGAGPVQPGPKRRDDGPDGEDFDEDFDPLRD